MATMPFSHKIVVNKLAKEEIEYELKIRGSDIGTVAEMRSTLRSCFQYENEGRSLQLKKYLFSCKDDQEEVTERLTEITDLIETFDGIPNSGIHTKITTKLAHIGGRIDRMQVDSEDEFDIQAKFKIKTLQLDAMLTSKLKAARKASPKVPLEVSLESAKSSSEASDEEELSRPSISAVNSIVEKQVKNFIPIYKWGISFAGSKQESVNAFLERVDDLCRSRGASQSDLLQSATELLSDEALIWYRANRCLFTSWNDFSQGLKEQFQSPFYSEELFEEIKRRTQGKDESVGMYLAKMSNLFCRLGTPVSEEAKVRILLRNIHPYYQAQLIQSQVTSVEHLKILCKKLEAAKISIDNYAPPPARNQSLEPDLAYMESRDKATSHAIAGPSSQNAPTCHRCHKPGHFARNCNQKYCFKCGKVGYTVKSCPNCSYKKSSGNFIRGQ